MFCDLCQVVEKVNKTPLSLLGLVVQQSKPNLCKPNPSLHPGAYKDVKKIEHFYVQQDDFNANTPLPKL